MEKMKMEMEPMPSSTQSMAQEPKSKADPRNSDPALDAEGFVTVPTTEPDKKEEIPNPKESQIQSEQSPGLRNSVHRSPQLNSEPPVADHGANISVTNGYDPSVAQDPDMESSAASFKDKIETVRDAIWRWKRAVGEASKKAEDLAENTWQHLKTSPSFAEAAMGRLAQGTKVLAEGGYEKIFRQTFETDPEEKLLDSFACYLNTSAGPVMGVLYVSTEKLAYCSDSPLSYKDGTQTEWNYYKVLIPLHQLKAVNPSSNKANPSEKYIQVNSVDAHEFWFMGFLNYEGAVQCLQEIFQLNTL